MYTHWSQLWNMPVLIPCYETSKNKILVKTFVLMSHLLTSREIIFKLCSKERYLEREQTSEEEWKFTAWKVHRIMNSYTNCISLFQSSTYSTMLWKSLSGLLWGLTKTACPLLLLLANLCLAILLGEEWVLKVQVHSLIGEHSWTGILDRRKPVSNNFQTQSNINKSGCCFWRSVCTWILHSLITGTSRNMVKAFNMCWIPDIAWE